MVGPIAKKVDLPGITAEREANYELVTLPETNIAPEKRCLEDGFPYGMGYFQVLY